MTTIKIKPFKFAALAAAALAVAAGFASNSYALRAYSSGLSTVPACSAQPSTQISGPPLAGANPGVYLRVPVNVQAWLPAAGTPLAYIPAFSDSANTPGVAVYSAPDNCAWQAQSSSLSTQIGFFMNPITVPAGSSGTEELPIGMAGTAGGPLAYGTETMVNTWSNSPLFTPVGCTTAVDGSNGEIEGPAIDCGVPYTTIENQYGMWQQNQVGYLNVKYSPSAQEASGTTDHGIIFVEIHNSTGYGYYEIPVSGSVQ